MVNSNLICESCGRIIKEDFRKDPRTKLKNPIPRFCSRACANKRVHTKETKDKISKALTGRKCTRSEKWYQAVEASTKKRHEEYLDKNAKVGKVELDITNRQLQEYREKHFICELCGREETCYTGSSEKNRRKRANNLCVDHRHSDNHFRGLLCRKCNYFLGWYENLEPIIQEYLKR